MAELIEVTVANLTGEALNWAVAKAEGLDVFLVQPEYNNPWRVFVQYAGDVIIRDVRYAPQGSWNDVGLLIEKYGIDLEQYLKFRWRAEIEYEHSGFGDTPLIAACRAIVAAKLGYTVQVPKELI